MADFTLSACRSIFWTDPEPPFALNGRRRKSQGEVDEAATHPRPAAFSCMITSLREVLPKRPQRPGSTAGLIQWLRRKGCPQSRSLDRPQPGGPGVLAGQRIRRRCPVWGQGRAVRWNAPCGILACAPSGLLAALVSYLRVS